MSWETNVSSRLQKSIEFYLSNSSHSRITTRIEAFSYIHSHPSSVVSRRRSRSDGWEYGSHCWHINGRRDASIHRNVRLLPIVQSRLPESSTVSYLMIVGQLLLNGSSSLTLLASSCQRLGTSMLV